MNRIELVINVVNLIETKVALSMWLHRTNMAQRQPMKACNDNGDQCDACRRCVTHRVLELLLPEKGPAWGCCGGVLN